MVDHRVESFLDLGSTSLGFCPKVLTLGMSLSFSVPQSSWLYKEGIGAAEL